MSQVSQIKKSLLKLYAIILFNCAICGNCFSQNNIIDSLKNAFSIAKHDTDRCRLLLQLSEACDDSNSESINKQLEKLSAQKLISEKQGSELYNKYLLYHAFADYSIGRLLFHNGDQSKAVVLIQSALTVFDKLKNDEGIYSANYYLAQIYLDRNEIERSLDAYKKALIVLEKSNEKMGLATVCNDIGFIYKDQGNIRMALEYFERALKLNEEL